MKVKVTIKVTADGNEVAKEKVVREVNSIADGADLRTDAHETINRIASDLRRRAGV